MGDQAVKYLPIPAEIETTAKLVIDAAYKVHTELGAGLLESIYETCLAHELGKSGVLVEAQVSLPIVYDNLKLEAGYRLDMLVNKHLIVEIKAVEAITDVHRAQYDIFETDEAAIGALDKFQRCTSQKRYPSSCVLEFNQ